ncbi:MAG TPA: gluconokinase [Aggregatilineales bacterium]|nr:gluconokinase [Chloroflexota bacterium]HOA24902.1 gluconokinase [Aggregatilineales bacterium]HPV07133.1 gluconokinase [Aggregatilineales bacterium]HQA67745.1 gluconokinase [Aggregatilineales bacterium]HQE18646.1 gluconokinase [Aggregatilineales bacterium]
MIVVLMGVSGSGKTTIGQMLAEQVGWPFYDGDSFHPPENIAKMRRGEPLTDADRDGWLAALSELAARLSETGQPALIACSALKHAYRERLREAGDDVRFVYLKGSYELIRTRLESRREHFFQPALLDSQFEALEEPSDAPTVDIQQPPEAIIQQIRQALGI